MGRVCFFIFYSVSVYTNYNITHMGNVKLFFIVVFYKYDLYSFVMQGRHEEDFGLFA